MMEDLSLHILDIVENAIAAGASRIQVSVNENEKRDTLTIRVKDNGPGMPEAAKGRALDPFYTTKKKRTGLGLPLLAQAADQSGGEMSFEATRGRGTNVVARFRHSHVDRPPLTKMTETLMLLILGHPEIDFRYSHKRNEKSFEFSGRKFLKDAGAESWFDPELIGAVKETLRRGLGELGRT